ncbi:sensor domain-containing diguanylate cyclase [Desulfovibrio sp.]|uniref:sensor domain-containing diguanylate cyclase n=1 Tax=Desulfovibrio sp. TaxID=885 RepID=UPI0025C406F8|nr:sensor domain-containing diguanylate cyclase [Desulfovibrio sp.]
MFVALYLRAGYLNEGLDEAEFSLTQRVQRVAEMTELKFDTIRKLTALLATDSRIVAALKGEGDLAECTRYLQSVGDTLRLHRAFLLDTKGICVASNDANLASNLVGVNLSDREYFARAMRGESSAQFVVGRVSTVAGFHFSAPVMGPNGYLGVVVLKLDKDTLAQQLYLPTGFVTDNAGVVVVSDLPENMLRVVPGGSAATLDSAQNLLRYQRDRLESVYLSEVSVNKRAAWLLAPGGMPYLCKTMTIGKEGLSIYGFENLAPLLSDAAETFIFQMLTAFVFLVMGFAVIIGTTVNFLRDRYLRDTLEKLNDTLRVQAQHDALTGLLNRRMFDEMAEAWFAQTLRLSVPFSLVLFDIDHFKRLNDAFGHQAGDNVLREIAAGVQRELSRQGDRVFRIGGEEFAVLASAANEGQLRVVMEMIRKTVEDLRLKHPNGPGAVVTISLGGLLVRGCCDMTFDDAFRKSDEALYLAKARGRNRWVLAESCCLTDSSQANACHRSSN